MEPHTGLNILDYAVLTVILLSGLLALMRGFIREVFSLTAWVGAYFAAARFYPLAEPWARRYIKNPSVATDAAAVFVFCVAFIVLSIIGALIAGFIRGNALTAIDRSLGFVFGLLRGALVVCLLYLVAASILWPDIDKPPAAPAPVVEPQTQQAQIPADREKEKDHPPEWLLQAKTRPFMAYGAAELKTFIPEKAFEKSAQELEQKKDATQRLINQQRLDMLSTPATAPHGNGAAGPGYDDKSRASLDQLIGQKAKP